MSDISTNFHEKFWKMSDISTDFHEKGLTILNRPDTGHNRIRLY